MNVFNIQLAVSHLKASQYFFSVRLVNPALNCPASAWASGDRHFVTFTTRSFRPIDFLF